MLEACKETKSATGTIRLLRAQMGRGGFYRCFKLVGERAISSQRDRLLRPKHIRLGEEAP